MVALFLILKLIAKHAQICHLKCGYLCLEVNTDSVLGTSLNVFELILYVLHYSPQICHNATIQASWKAQLSTNNVCILNCA